MINIDVHSKYNIFLHKYNIFLIILLQGEYRIVVDKVYRCESRKNHSIKFNLYSSKKTLRITELKGNVTLLTPLDDTLIVSI